VTEQQRAVGESGQSDRIPTAAVLLAEACRRYFIDGERKAVVTIQPLVERIEREASAAPPEPPLDVERLARALERTHLMADDDDCLYIADATAAEYHALGVHEEPSSPQETDASQSRSKSPRSGKGSDGGAQ